MYYSWKGLNESNAVFNTRRINFPESISEGIGSASLGLLRTNNVTIHGARSSSCDAIDPNTGLTYQFKACSTIVPNPRSGSPSTFGPRSEYDILIFLHMDCNEDKMYFYLFNEDLYNIKMNNTETFEDQCEAGRRPRLDVLARVKRNNIPYMGYFDFNKGEYIENVESN